MRQGGQEEVEKSIPFITCWYKFEMLQTKLTEINIDTLSEAQENIYNNNHK